MVRAVKATNREKPTERKNEGLPASGRVIRASLTEEVTHYPSLFLNNFIVV